MTIERATDGIYSHNHIRSVPDAGVTAGYIPRGRSEDGDEEEAVLRYGGD